MQIARNAASSLLWLTRLRGGSRQDKRQVIEAFHREWYQSKVWKESISWEGVPLLKNPLDMWMYQQIVFDTTPDLIVETGSFRGGSALYFGRLLDLLGRGRVVSIDVNAVEIPPAHPRVQFLTGSSVAKEVLTRVRQMAAGSSRVMVVLDSDHSKDHVLKELIAYEGLVTEGCYLCVEDTNVNGHPVVPSHGPGPMEAVTEFLEGREQVWRVDSDCERFLMTFNPSGWLLRLSPAPDG
jgi:cephalosporin hydroxylase